MLRSTAIFLLLISCTGQCSQTTALPQDLRITVDAHFQDVPVAEDQSACATLTESPTTIRQKLKRFHHIDQITLHDRYDFVACGVSGKIHYRGRTFVWKSFLGGILQTDYPGGTLHYLAGKPISSGDE